LDQHLGSSTAEESSTAVRVVEHFEQVEPGAERFRPHGFFAVREAPTQKILERRPRLEAIRWQLQEWSEAWVAANPREIRIGRIAAEEGNGSVGAARRVLVEWLVVGAEGENRVHGSCSETDSLQTHREALFAG
jgi:hypothetical protein